MNVSLNWLNGYLDSKLEVHEVEVALTNLGLEVENVQDLGSEVSKVVIGEIKEITKHEDADKLLVCSVNVGEKELITIITGADNIYEGMKVPVALVGATVVGGKIKESKLRGKTSYGMLCSGEELGLDNSLLSEIEKNGILDLGLEAPIGEDIKVWLGLNDHVLDIGLTPNRSDCHGIYNVAREASIAFTSPLKELDLKVGQSGEASLTTEILEPEDCQRYVSRVVRNVVIKESPTWLKNALRNVGVRPINNIVDITNFVMFELGHPMHAFDLDTFTTKEIKVRKAKTGEKITTLDGVERILDEEMLLICDGETPVALGGVMGGLDSEVTKTTKRILLESAYFRGTGIRKTSRKLGLRSEASTRYEKGISPENTLVAMNRAAYLIEALGVGEVEAAYGDCYPLKQEIPTIRVTASWINKILGMNILKQEMVNIFTGLGFKVLVLGDEDSLDVTPLPHRIDIKRDVDLVEEIIRVYGYDKLPATLPIGQTNTLEKPFSIILVEQTKDIMVSLGFNEVVSYSFHDRTCLEKIRLENKDSLAIMNPLSEKQSIMRTHLLPGVLENASRNYKRQQREIAIFEVGKIFLKKEEGLPVEKNHLAALIVGKDRRTWYQKQTIDFFYLKGVLEELASNLGVKGLRLERETNNETYHPGRCGLIYASDKLMGIIGELHPRVLGDYDIKEKTYYFELDLAIINKKETPLYQGLPKHPSVERDMAFIVPIHTTIEQIEGVIEKASHKKVICHQLFDVYEGKQIEENYKSIAYTLTYQDQDATLTDLEVTKIHEGILSSLEIELGAKLR